MVPFREQLVERPVCSEAKNSAGGQSVGGAIELPVASLRWRDFRALRRVATVEGIDDTDGLGIGTSVQEQRQEQQQRTAQTYYFPVTQISLRDPHTLTDSETKAGQWGRPGRDASPGIQSRSNAKQDESSCTCALQVVAIGFPSVFSTAIHRRFSQSCDEQPLLRIPESASWRDARNLSQSVFRQPPSWRPKIAANSLFQNIYPQVLTAQDFARKLLMP